MCAPGRAAAEAELAPAPRAAKASRAASAVRARAGANGRDGMGLGRVLGAGVFERPGGRRASSGYLVVDRAVNCAYRAHPVTTSKGTRLPPDERREQLVALGLELLGRTAPDQVSIEAIARAAGISKGLLYHYFPTKSDFVVAVLRRSREELERRMAPDPAVAMSVGDRLDASIDGFLGYVSEHAVGFQAMAQARGGGDVAIRAVIAENR